jgi:hypothetical protein
MMANNSEALRIVAWYASAIAAAVVILATPSVGDVALFFLGAFWVSVLLNALAIHLAAGAIFGGLPRICLIIPTAAYVTWFAAYLAITVQPGNNVASLESENRVDIAVPNDLPLLFSDDDHKFASTVKTYVLGGPVFAGNYEMVVLQDCGRRFRNVAAGPDNPILSCVIPSMSTIPASGLRFQKIVDTSDGPNGWRVAYSIEQTDGVAQPKAVGHFEYGAVKRLSALPLFYFACTTSNTQSNRGCFFRPLEVLLRYGEVGRSIFGTADVLRDDYNAASLARILGRPTAPYAPASAY